MKKLILFSLLAVITFSCEKRKPDTKYRVECAGYDITSSSVISNEHPTPKYFYGNNAQSLQYEWVGIKYNKITVTLNHSETLGEGTIKLFADDVLIGKVTGQQPTLFIDLAKK